MRKGTTWGMLLVEDAEDLLEWVVDNGEHLLHETPDLQRITTVSRSTCKEARRGEEAGT